MQTTKTSKQPASETSKQIYRDPIGSGAIDFALPYMVGLTFANALPTIKQLMAGELHDTEDKRVKRCDFCGHWWRDSSVRNRKQTCSLECKTGIKSLQKRQQRADKALLNPKPKKKTRREEYYIHWLEYPFWLDERKMLSSSWSSEAPYSNKKLEIIDAAKQRDSIIGGKRKSKKVIPYNGDEEIGDGESLQQKVSVKYTAHKDKSAREPGEIQPFYMSPAEMESYFKNKYSEHHLKMERRRAVLSSDKK